MCSLILKPIPCLQNESISLTSIVKFILKITHTSQKIMFHLLCFKWGRGGGYTTPSTPPSKVLYFLAMSNHPHLMLHVTCVCLLLWLISNTLKNFYVSKLNPILNIPQLFFKSSCLFQKILSTDFTSIIITLLWISTQVSLTTPTM